MVPLVIHAKRISQRFPRASGDGPVDGVAHLGLMPFPPRERGWSPAQ